MYKYTLKRRFGQWRGVYPRVVGAALALLCAPGMALALQCTEADRLGNRSVARVETAKGGAVTSFHWIVTTPAGGMCVFDSADFKPVPRRSGAEFRSAKGCRLFIWTQGNGTTLAPQSCEAQCTGPDVHDYLWPIIFDKNGKGCGRPR